jgi:hypothetical protein
MRGTAKISRQAQSDRPMEIVVVDQALPVSGKKIGIVLQLPSNWPSAAELHGAFVGLQVASYERRIFLPVPVHGNDVAVPHVFGDVGVVVVIQRFAQPLLHRGERKVARAPVPSVLTHGSGCAAASTLARSTGVRNQS